MKNKKAKVKTLDDLFSEDRKPSTIYCAHPECGALGEFRAPKSKIKLDDYTYFCTDHIRDYNQSWNYFENMSQEEIYVEMHKDGYWQSPTWPMHPHRHLKSSQEKTFKDYFDFFGNTKEQKRYYKDSGYNDQEIKAMELLSLSPPIEEENLKKAYIKLVKKFHPDLNQGDKNSEEFLKKINLAYATLNNHLKKNS